MNVNLIIESAPAPQARMSFSVGVGTLVIGRGDDADWQLNDPDMYLSRKHCIITMADDTLSATDASRDGTYIDGSETALGAGNSVVLEDGMRMRIGDFVLRVDMGAVAEQIKPAMQTKSSPFDFGPEDSAPPAPQTDRPDTLPDPFDPYAKNTHAQLPERETHVPKPFSMDDPFALDPARPATPDPAPSSGGGGYFDTPARPTPTPSATPPQAEPEPTQDPNPTAFEFKPAPAPTAPAPAPQPRVQTQPVAPTQPAAPTRPATDSAVMAALLKGMGVNASELPQTDPLAQAEAIGAQYRIFVEGVMQMLRARASAKQQVRAAQTLIASADVNPLKFLATTDDALDTLLSADRPGYLPAEDAITGAYRDLADHQMRTWKALQSALRRMIDQFDPTSIEAEIADTGMLGSLLAGGRNALLWQAYEEKYRDIARAAEERFLGEVGADFRDAYENNDKEERS